MPTGKTLEETLDELKRRRDQLESERAQALADIKQQHDRYMEENKDWIELIELVRVQSKRIGSYSKKMRRILVKTADSYDFQIDELNQEMRERKQKD